MNHLDITVTNTTNSTAPRPVTGGVPIAEGAAPKGCGFMLKDHRGRPVPCQSRVIARWPDSSARWVLLDFQSQPPANGAAKYRLTWDAEQDSDASAASNRRNQMNSPAPQSPVKARGGSDFLMKSGSLSIKPSKNGLIELPGYGDIAFLAVDRGGRECLAEVESATVEVKGPMHSTLLLKGAFRSLHGRRSSAASVACSRSNGHRLFGFRTYIHIYAGLRKLLVEPMVLMDAGKGVVQRFREVRLEVRPCRAVQSTAIGGAPASADRLLQVDDQQYTLGRGNRKGRAPGWAQIASDGATTAVAVRDFWQQWPKALKVGPEGIKVGLFPRFEAGTFDHMLDPWYKHDYLFDGDCYRMRTGQVRRWQVWIDLDGNGEALTSHANAPLVPAADPAQAMATGIFGDVLPAGAPGMADYDQWAKAAFEGYVEAIDSSRDYGAMNWGDWFGERRCNWGNEEYDTTRQIVLEYARTGDPKYLHTGGANARHNSEVDIIHFVNSDLARYFTDQVCKSYTNRSIIDNYPIRPGMNHAHCVGHVGGFHSVAQIRKLYLSFQGRKYGSPYLCLDPYCISHVFTQGMAWYYFFTGDPWARETIIKIADNLSQLVLDRKFPFTGRACAGRELGWPLLAIAAAYELDHNKRYMRAMRTLAGDALAEQDPNCGGWLQQLGGGHCGCKKRQHIGEAGFVTSIRMNALYRYYRLSGDERMPECIRRGLDNMNEDLWNDHTASWRYTSCPASPSLGRPGVTMMIMASAVWLFADPEHKRILKKAWDAIVADSRHGAKSGFSSYGIAEAASVLSGE